VRSLRGRLHLGLAISVLLLIAATRWFCGETLYRGANNMLLSRLQNDAEALVGAFRLGPDGAGELGFRHLAPVYNQPLSGHYYLVETAEGERLRSRSLWDQELDLLPLDVGETISWTAAGPDGQRLLVWSGGYRRFGRPFTVTVAEDVTPMEQELATLERFFTITALTGLVVVLLIQHQVVRLAFLRLRPAYRDIDRMERGEAGSVTDEVPAEIVPLVRKINRLLDLLGKRLERSRSAAGNLAHAIKGPLNLMIQELDRDPSGIDPALRGRLCDQVERVHGLMDRELKRARIAGDSGTGRRFDPREELPVLARLLERMYPDKDLDVDYRIETRGLLPVEREDMLEYLGTVLDNACKWARSRVLCTISPGDGCVFVRIEDDGPGCTEAELESIRRRGTRYDESVNGHGLGLSIAEEIAESYSGHLELGRSELLGGFLAVLTLLTAQQAPGGKPRGAGRPWRDAGSFLPERPLHDLDH
jgi:signal transduction histidine kinase